MEKEDIDCEYIDEHGYCHHPTTNGFLQECILLLGADCRLDR